MIIEQLANELGVASRQIQATVSLLDGGATVPFIARYRKEVTEGLDDTQLRQLEQRLGYLRELEDRRSMILKSIEEQEKLTPELADKLRNAETKSELEDLYLPYKPKRRTKGQIALEAGLGELADALFADQNADPEQTANDFVNADKGVTDSKAALDGARYILMERLAEDAALLQRIRQHLQRNAHIASAVVTGKEKEASKFSDYFSHSEALNKVPSHRALAMFRGRNEGLLQVSLNADPERDETDRGSHCETLIAEHISFQPKGRPGDAWLQSVVQWTWRVKIMLHMETELFGDVRERAEQEAIQVFAKNLYDLLMAAPAGAKVTMGLDPGLRTGVKVAIVDNTGKVLATNTIFPHAPQNQWDKSLRTLVNLCQQHKVELISIGNGTASRETDKLAAEVLKALEGVEVNKIMVSEAGASVYSASELAASELNGMDVSLRGAVSIARRLQDPLAELVKIEPKAIGVGQYQHDVNQSRLGKSLEAVIEDCVNAVGVDVNMASPALLSHISGLNKTLANNIIQHRDNHGAFNSRKDLLSVERLGPKAFEQCAGFLRIAQGADPLDASAVHPEAYPLVETIAAKSNTSIAALIGNSEIIATLQPKEFTNDTFGLPTVTDIIKELDKPGRDPRPEFKTANFKEGVETMADLTPGMILEGVVSNVANFGAFVDIGVHQDGLVHISALTNKFVSDPREVVKAGDIVKVKVTDVDVDRKRISLSMRLNDEAKPQNKGSGKHKPRRNTGKSQPRKQDSAPSAMGNAFAAAFAKANQEK